MNEFTTALYIRLSQDDGNEGESDSVKNQRDLLTDFVKNHPDLSKSRVLTFIDDGFTGTNFDRPKVKEMLALVKSGDIQAVAVKDFSRFGRNYIEVGTYLEQIFPFLGVRFLSVTDHFDSNDKATGAGGIEVAFKTLIHDLYSRDLSVKCKTGKMAKTAKGEHVCDWATYGYIRSKTTKNAWEIDEAAAVTVRRVFDMALEGMTVSEIAGCLNADGVPTPLTHRRASGTIKGTIGRCVDQTPFWTMANVTKILRDERYTGKLIAGMTRRAAVGSRKCVPVPESEWIVVPDAHPAIVTEETFKTIQNTLGPYRMRKLNRVNVNIFAGKIICGHCGHALRRYGGARMKNVRFLCQSHRLIQREPCFTDMIYENMLKEVVLAAVRQEASLACASRIRVGENRERLLCQRDTLSGLIKTLQAEIRRLKTGKTALFEDYADGKLDREKYLSLNAEKTAAIEKALTEIAALTDELEAQSKTAAQNGVSQQMEPFIASDEVTSQMMALIDKILVFDGERIEIRFAFADSRGD